MIVWAAVFATVMVAINAATMMLAARELDYFERLELGRPLVLFNLCGAMLLASLLWSWWSP